MSTETVMPQKGEMTWFQKFKESAQFFLLVLGACWGIYTFIYKEIIVPAGRPPALSLTATLEELDRADCMILVRAHLVVENRGDAKVWVPALWWHVYGLSFNGETRTPLDFAKAVRPLLKDEDGEFERFSSIRQKEVVAAWRISDFEYWYQPKDETIHEQLFLVPEGQFDSLQIVVEADITKSIDTFAPTHWEIADTGVLMPTLLLKDKGWDKDHPSRVAVFEPRENGSQRMLENQVSAGHNSTVATLRIKSKMKASKDQCQKR